MTELSIYQENIDKAYTTTESNLVIDAFPGSGKTFTLLHLAKKTPFFKSSIFLAFNKSISEELSKRLPPHIKAMTLHSLGMRNLIRYYGFAPKLVEAKTFIIAKKCVNVDRFDTLKKQNTYLYRITQLVDLCRSNLIDDPSLVSSLAYDYDLLSGEQEILDCFIVKRELDKYNSKLKSGSMIDFTDMLYLCKDIPKKDFKQYEVVFIDESQDLNPLQKLVVDKIIAINGRFIAVGDEKQCIYTFMGSNLQSFKSYKSTKNTLSLPLSVTYRCSKEVTKEANLVFEGMESFETNIEGSVRDGRLYEVGDGDFVLCRNNKPLVEAWVYLLKSGIKSHIYGRDYGESLLKLLDEIDSVNIETVKERFEQKRLELYRELFESGVTNISAHPKIVKFDEMTQILFILFEEFGSVSSTIEQVHGIFTTEVGGVTLMTIHKSKGLEARRVFFLFPNLIPSTYAESQQMLYAEKCLYYVAVTRAKEELIYVRTI